MNYDVVILTDDDSFDWTYSSEREARRMAARAARRGFWVGPPGSSDSEFIPTAVVRKVTVHRGGGLVGGLAGAIDDLRRTLEEITFDDPETP